jgi:hypothetical protein
MVHPVLRVLAAAALAGAVMIGAVLVDSARDKPAPMRPDAAPVVTVARASNIQTAPSASIAPSPASAADAAAQGVSDEQVLALLDAHPELRASIEALLNEPDPVVRKESAALVLELAAATADTARAR